jgi:peptide deformylase
MMKSPRRGILVVCAAGLFLSLAGCGLFQPSWAWLPEEKPLVEAARDDFDVVARGGPESRVLRMRTRTVPASFDLNTIASRMEKAMYATDGVGIAAPQVGLNIRATVVMLDYKTDDPYVIFARNPVIIERSDETKEGYEGCLSVPDVGGLVRRNRWVRVEYLDETGEQVVMRAEGPNAVLWQHEIDHLDGILYTDKVLGELLPWERVKELREEMEKDADAKETAPSTGSKRASSG